MNLNGGGEIFAQHPCHCVGNSFHQLIVDVVVADVYVDMAIASNSSMSVVVLAFICAIKNMFLALYSIDTQQS
jgi:hypothetical protein